MQLEMYRDNSPVAEFELPDGFSIRSFREGDGKQWCLCCRGGELGCDDEPASEELFAKKMLSDPKVKRENILFVVDKDGTIAGTATYQLGHNEKSGYLHMVAVKKEYLGRRLAAPLCAAAVKLAIEDGKEYILLNTDDWRIPAIKVYLKLGFVPVICDEDMPSRWLEIMKKLGINSLECVDKEYRKVDNLRY